MKKSLKPVVFAILGLTIAALACSLGGTREPLLGETYQSDEGGFIIQEVIGYTFEDTVGVVNMTAPGGQSDVGPGIMVMGGLVEQAYSNDELLESMRAQSETIEVSKGMKIKVGGVEGLLADLSGEYNGQLVQGKMLVAMPRQKQEFVVLALAPEAGWKELAPIFDALIDSVVFIDAIPMVASSPAIEDQPEPIAPQPENNTPVTAEEPEEIRQWAIYAEASSEYTSSDWSAMRATGAPDVTVCGDDVNAWAASDPDTEEYIILQYAVPVNPTELVIYQSHNPSQVVEIQFIDVTGETWMLWYGDPQEVAYCPHVWTHTIELNEVFYTDTVVIFVDQSAVDWGWVEIDAVELVGVPEQSSQTAQPAGSEEPAEPEQPTEVHSTDTDDLPTNYTGLMAGPIYQGWVNIIIGETIEADLDNIMTIPGRKSTDSWKPRESHKQTYLFDMPWDDMTAFISVTNDGLVYKKSVSTTVHPDDFILSTVNEANYEELKNIYDRDKVIPYAVMANLLESPGFLREQYIREEDGMIVSTYNWYNAAGDRMVGIFYNDRLTGIIGLSLIPAE
jgi:hypothetical protein